MLIQSSNIYEILGVDRNADTKTIKKAYAKLVKQYHPEEHPEEWKRIHDAYEQAMEPKEAPNTPVETPGSKTQPQIQSLSAEQQEKLEDIFVDVESIIREQKEQQEKADQKKIDRELQTIRQLTKKKEIAVSGRVDGLFLKKKSSSDHKSERISYGDG